MSDVSEEHSEYFREQQLIQTLLSETALTSSHLDDAMRVRNEEGRSLLDGLLTGLPSAELDILRVVAKFWGVEVLETLNPDDVDLDLIGEVPINYAKTHFVLPLHRDADQIQVVLARPDDTSVCDDLRMIFDAEIVPVLSTRDEILDLINRVYAKRTSAVELDESEDFQSDAEELVDIIDASDEAPIIRWVNSLIFQAVKERASDVHVEPGEREVIVRYRIDGVLYEVRRANRNYLPSIIARVKIMAGLNIAEKRLPQDGRIRRRIAGKDIDMRVATAPTARGERITIRLLDKTAVVLDLADIGMGDVLLSKVQELIARPNGILLVTGPTGSGKTTTLYAALSAINTPDKNILTIEDPVEYQLEGISQTQVNSKIDLTFASGLRSFLRHDPDVIMVGEIRDLETAEIAIQASLTGHLVFSTLHTNDAPSAVTRLVDMDVEPFLVASSVLALMAQRLVRKVCSECRQLRQATQDEISGLGLTMDEFMSFGQGAEADSDQSRKRPPAGMVYHPGGCKACLDTGYTGRIGIYELLVMEDGIRSLIMKNADASTIKKAAVERGMATLRADGAQKVCAGLTTIEEVMRVTQEDVI